MVRVGLSLMALLSLLLGVTDPFAAEGDPIHSHIVLGGSPIEQARILAEHLRSGGPPRWTIVGHSRDAAHDQPQPHVAHSDHRQPARLFAIRSSTVVPSITNLQASVMLVTTVPTMLPAVPTIGVIADVDQPLLSLVRTLVDPPPRDL